MKSVLLRGPILTSSGYGVHSRQIARWLINLANKGAIDLYIDITRWGNTSWLLNPAECDGLVGDVIKYSRIPKDASGNRRQTDISFQVILPNEWTTTDARYNIGVTAAVETDRCNPLWIDACNKMNAVVVPSTHTANIMRRSGNLTTPMHVIPEAYIDAIRNESPKVDFGFETSFNFLVVSQLTSDVGELDRKNVFNTLRLLTETFASAKDVGIVLKTNSGRASKIDRQITEMKLRNLLKTFRKGQVGPPVYLVHGNLSDVEMTALYRAPSIKALCNFTRGEGFGLPILEAAAAGLPVITTDWSGHLDFMNRGKFIKIGYRLSPIPKQKVDNHEDKGRNIFIRDAQWAQPSESNIRTALKKFHISPDIPTQWAADLSKILINEYSYDAVAGMYDKLFLDMLVNK